MKAIIFVLTVAMVVMMITVHAHSHPYANEQEKCQDVEYPVTKLGIRRPINEAFASFSFGVTTRDVPAGPLPGIRDIRYVRVLIEAQRADCNWFVTVRDEKYHVIQTLVRSDFSRRLTWTRRVPGSKAIIEFQGCKGVEASQIKLKEMILMESKGTNTYYSSKIPGNPDWKDLYEDRKALTIAPQGNYRSLGDYVGLVMTSEGDENWVCTGVLVSKDLVLTNWHCGGADPDAIPTDRCWDQEILNDTIIDFSFDDDKISREYQVTGCVAHDVERDFALLRIAPLEFKDTLKPATISVADLTSGQHLQMVHHPSGEPKRISFACTVIDCEYEGWKNPQLKTEFTHQCDSERGSSGGAIFNLQGQLVGLHHLGYADNKGPCDHKNKAISMRSIVEFLQQPRFRNIATDLNISR